MTGCDLSAKGKCVARSMLLKDKSYKSVYTRIFSVFLKEEMEKAAHVVTEVNPMFDFEFSALAATQLPVNWLGEFGVRSR